MLFVLLASVALEGVALFLLAGGSILVRLLAGDADAVGEPDNDAGSSVYALVRSPLASVAVLVPGAVRLRAVFAVGVRYLYGGEADEVIRFMEPEPTPEAVPDPVMSGLDYELQVLKAVEGVDQVYESFKGRFDASNLNRNLVKCRVAMPDGERFQVVMKKCGCGCPDKLAAARVVKADVSKLLGAAAIEAAERLVQSRHVPHVTVTRFPPLCYGRVRVTALRRD